MTPLGVGRRGPGGLVPALVGFVWARVCIAIGYLLAHQFPSSVEQVPRYDEMMSQGLLAWDGFFYRLLIDGWYGAVPPDGVRFFPLYPAVARPFGFLLGGRNDLALLLVANVGALIGALLLWQLVLEVIAGQDGDGSGVASVTDLADRSAWMVAVVPAAMTFAMSYTEGPALALNAGVLLMMHRRRWWWCAGLASTLR